MATVHVEHSLAPAELVRSLCAVATAEALGEEVAHGLQKALDATLHLPEEPWLLGLVRTLHASYGTALEALGRNLDRWFTAQFAPRALAMAKAVPGVQLTAEQIEELRMLVAAHFRPATVGLGSASYAISERVWRRWEAEGIVVRGIPIPEIVDAFVAGRLYQVITEGTTYAEMRKLAGASPLSEVQKLAVEWAEDHAAEAMVGFGQRRGHDAASAALSQNQRYARRLMADYLRGDLKLIRPPLTPGNLSPRQRRALETEHVAQDWKALGRQLYKTFKGSDGERDWLRVAASETRLATNVGRVLAFQEHGVRALYYLVRPDACAHCKALLLEPDGTPRIFPLTRVLAALDATGGTNVGRKASRIGDPDEGWIVNGGLLHPWCRCRPMPVILGQAPLRLGR